jgi:hypothetical protein
MSSSGSGSGSGSGSYGSDSSCSGSDSRCSHESTSPVVFVPVSVPVQIGPQRRKLKVDRSLACDWKRTLWEAHVEGKLRENSWYEYYHMPVESFYALHSLLFSEADIKMCKLKGDSGSPMGSIDTRVKLACCLRELFGEKRKSLVDVFKISKASARLAFIDCLKRMNSCKELECRIFDTDHSHDALAVRSRDFSSRSSFPTILRDVVGAIDGLFIKTRQPKVSEVGNVRTYYSGHKMAFGINMQGVCDATCRFIGFACNTPGSTSDYVAFRHTNFYSTWSQLPSPYYYVGDCAYPLGRSCLIPFVGTNLPVEEDCFNFFHSQLRITVERSFGIFVNVFGIFHAPLLFNISTCCKVVEACVRLHNYRIDQGCQQVSRRPGPGPIYRQAFDRSGDAYDVLDDERYRPDRPHATDAAYAAHVAAAELHSGPGISDAAAGKLRRDALTHALALAGAERPTKNRRE